MVEYNALPLHWLEFIMNADEVTVRQESPPDILEGSNLESAHPNDFGSLCVPEGVVRSIVLGSLERSKFLAAINQGIEEADDHYRCFTPHHFLDAKSQAHHLNLAICFRCHWIWGFFNEEKASFNTSRFAQPLFDSYFPEFKAERDLEERLSQVRRRVDGYSVCIPKVIEAELTMLDELENEIREMPVLDCRNWKLRDLQAMKQKLHKLIRPES